MSAFDAFRLTDPDHLAEAQGRFVHDPQNDVKLSFGGVVIKAGRWDGWPILLVEAPDATYLLDPDLASSPLRLDGYYDGANEP